MRRTRLTTPRSTRSMRGISPSTRQRGHSSPWARGQWSSTSRSSASRSPDRSAAITLVLVDPALKEEPHRVRLLDAAERKADVKRRHADDLGLPRRFGHGVESAEVVNVAEARGTEREIGGEPLDLAFGTDVAPFLEDGAPHPLAPGG